MSSRCSGRLLFANCNNTHLNSNDRNHQENSRSDFNIRSRLATFHRSILVLVLHTCAVYVLSSVGESNGEGCIITGEFESSYAFTNAELLMQELLMHESK